MNVDDLYYFNILQNICSIKNQLLVILFNFVFFMRCFDYRIFVNLTKIYIKKIAVFSLKLQSQEHIFK